MTYNPFEGATAGALQEGDTFNPSVDVQEPVAEPLPNPLAGKACPKGGVTDNDGYCEDGKTPEQQSEQIAADKARAEADKQAEILAQTQLAEQQAAAMARAEADKQAEIQAQTQYEAQQALPEPPDNLTIELPNKFNIKAQDEFEFEEMTLYLNANNTVISSLKNYSQPINESFPDFKNRIEDYKVFNTPENQKYQYWTMMANRQSQIISDIKKYSGLETGYKPGKNPQPNPALKARSERTTLYTNEQVTIGLQQARSEYEQAESSRTGTTAKIVGQTVNSQFQPIPLFEYTRPDGIKINTDGTVTKNGDPVDIVPFSKTDINNLVENTPPERLDHFFKQNGDTPITRGLLLGMGLNEEEITQILGRQPKLDKVKEILDVFTMDDGTDSTLNQKRRTIAAYFSGDAPAKVKNLSLSVLDVIKTVTGFDKFELAVNLYSAWNNAWVKGVSAAFRPEPYELWKGVDFWKPTENLSDLLGIPHPNPNILEVFKEHEHKTTTNIKEILPVTEPLQWLVGGGGGKVAVQGAIKGVDELILKVAQEKFFRNFTDDVLTKTFEPMAKKLGVEIKAVLHDADSLIQNTFNEAVAPKSITTVEKVPLTNKTPLNGTEEQLADGTWVQTKKVTQRIPENGEAVPPESLRPDTDIPGVVRTTAPKAEVKPTEVPKPTEALPSEAQKPLIEGVASKTPKAEIPATEVPKVEVPLTPRQQARTAAREAWNKSIESHSTTLGTPGAYTKEDIDLYKALVNLAKEEIKAGVKTIEEFAKATGVKINNAVINAWKEANGNANFVGFDNLPSHVKDEVSKVKFIVERNYNPTEQVAVDDLKSWGKVFDEAWAKVTPENQAKIAQKARNLESVMAAGGDVTEQHKVLGGLLKDAGFDPVQFSRLNESVDTLKSIAARFKEVDVYRRHDVMEALDRMKQGIPPRKFEIEYMNEIFGEDTIAAFEMLQKNRIGDKVHSLLYNAMLTPVSQLKNFIGNTIAELLVPTEKILTALTDVPLSGFGKLRPRKYFFGEAPQDVVGMWQGIPDGFRSFLSVMKTGNVPQGSMLLKGEVQKGAFEGWGGLLELNTRGLSAADQLAKSIRYSAEIRSLAYRQAASEKLTGNAFAQRFKALIEYPTEDIVKAAQMESKYRLFQKSTEFGKKIISARNSFDIKGVQPLRIILPFVPTPVNLVKYGLERSPLAALDWRMWTAVVKKNPEAAPQIAKWVMGSLGAAALGIYAKDGLITGDPPDNVADRDEFYREGKQPYSVKVGDKWISYKGIEPFNQIFLQVANVIEAINDKKADKDIVKMASKAATSFGSNLVSQNFMSGLSNFLDAVKYPERYGEQYLQNLIMFPYSGTARIAAQTIDTTIREPNNAGQVLAAKIPGLSQSVPAKTNVLGDEQKREYPGIFPVPYSTEKDDRVSKMLKANDVQPGFVGKSINNLELTDEQHQEYQAMAGRLLRQELEKIVSDTVSTTKRKQIETAITASREHAKKDYLKYLKDQGITPPKK
jgi:hypothetical protein